MRTYEKIQENQVLIVSPRIWKTWTYAKKQKYFKDLNARKKSRIINFKELIKKIKYIWKKIQVKKPSIYSFKLNKWKSGKTQSANSSLFKITNISNKLTFQPKPFKNKLYHRQLTGKIIFLSHTKFICSSFLKNQFLGRPRSFRSYNSSALLYNVYPAFTLFSMDTKWMDILFGGAITRWILAREIKFRSHKSLNYLTIPEWPSAELWGSFELNLLANIVNESSKLALIKSKCLYISNKETSLIKLNLKFHNLTTSNSKKYLFLYNRLWVIKRLKRFLIQVLPYIKLNTIFKQFLISILKNCNIKKQLFKLYKFCLTGKVKQTWLQTVHRMILLLPTANLILNNNKSIEKNLILPHDLDFIWFNLSKLNPYKLFIGNFFNENLIAVNTLKYNSINIWVPGTKHLRTLNLGINNSDLLIKTKKQIKTININQLTCIKIFRPENYNFSYSCYNTLSHTNYLLYSVPVSSATIFSNINFLNSLYLFTNKNLLYGCKDQPILKKFMSSLKISCFLSKYKLYQKCVYKNQKNYARSIILRQFGWYEVDSLTRLKWYRKWFKKRFSRFRKIKKDRMFRNLLKSHFLQVTGFYEKQLLNLWARFRRGTNKYWGPVNLVTKFSQSLLLMPENIILFLGFAPTQGAAKILIQSGGLSVNGLSSANLNYFVKPGDILQLNSKTWFFSKRMFSYNAWDALRLRLSFISFFQVDWSMLMFSLVRWPYIHELIAPSFLSERWVRYYIRQFPVKLKQFHNGKLEWKLYVLPKHKRNK